MEQKTQLQVEAAKSVTAVTKDVVFVNLFIPYFPYFLPEKIGKKLFNSKNGHKLNIVHNIK